MNNNSVYFRDEGKFVVSVGRGNENFAAYLCLARMYLPTRMYIYRNKLVTIEEERELRFEDIISVWVIKPLSRARLITLLREFILFLTMDLPPADAGIPASVVSAILSIDYSELVPTLSHISYSPVVLSDGRLQLGGYEPISKSFIAGSSVEAYYAYDMNQHELASDSISNIRNYFQGVRFYSELDFSVLVAALMTALICRRLDTKPAIAINAESPGSGKSMLVSAVSAFAFGVPVVPIYQPATEAQFNREIEDNLREEPGIISIDNVEFPIRGARLCQILTEPATRISSKGGSRSKNVKSPLIFFNGNNLRIEGPDLGRRVLVINLLSRVSGQFQDQLGADWIKSIIRLREVIVPEFLGLLSAFTRAGSPAMAPPLPSFENWSRAVRDPIIWAGLPDPVRSQDQLARTSVEVVDALQPLSDMTRGARFSAADLANLVANGSVSERDLRALLQASPGVLTATRIGKALHSLSKQDDGHLVVRRVGGHAGSAAWCVRPRSVN